MKTTYTIITLLLCSLLHAQEYATSYGLFEGNEFSLTTYDKDPNADAVVMFDKGKSHFEHHDGHFKVLFERQVRIKVLKESGQRWAEVEIPFYREGSVFEKVYDVSASAFNVENGIRKAVSLDKNAIYDEKLNNSWTLKKFMVPNVKEGTIIEYTYKIESDYVFNLHDWIFQWDIPVMHSEYEVRLVPFYEYTSLMRNVTRDVDHESYVDKKVMRTFAQVEYYDMVHTYSMQDVPAFYDEKFITSKEDYLMKLDFQLSTIHYPDGRHEQILTTWKEMKENLLKNDHFGKHIKKAKKLAPDLIDVEGLMTKSEKERFNTVIDYMKNNYSWDHYNAKYADKSCKDLIKTKEGNAADLNLFTIGLLQAVGLESNPLILSTRDHGRVRVDYPFAHFFNYVAIATKVNEGYQLSDVTEVNSINTRIPARCINDQGLIINESETEEWLTLCSMAASSMKKSFSVAWTDDLSLQVRSLFSYREYEALRMRNKYYNDKEEVQDMLKTKGFECVDSLIQIKNAEDKTKAYNLSFAFDDETEIIGEKIYFSPFFNECLDEVPFKQKERSYPIDMMYPRSRTFVSMINIPEGYEVDVLPKDRTINTEFYAMKYKVLMVGKMIKVDFYYTFKYPLYSAAMYSDIKFCYQEIVKKGNEKVVFIKKQ